MYHIPQVVHNLFIRYTNYCATLFNVYKMKILRPYCAKGRVPAPCTPLFVFRAMLPLVGFAGCLPVASRSLSDPSCNLLHGAKDS